MLSWCAHNPLTPSTALCFLAQHRGHPHSTGSVLSAWLLCDLAVQAPAAADTFIGTGGVRVPLAVSSVMTVASMCDSHNWERANVELSIARKYTHPTSSLVHSIRYSKPPVAHGQRTAHAHSTFDASRRKSSMDFFACLRSMLRAMDGAYLSSTANKSSGRGHGETRHPYAAAQCHGATHCVRYIIMSVGCVAIQDCSTPADTALASSSPQRAAVITPFSFVSFVAPLPCSVTPKRLPDASSAFSETAVSTGLQPVHDATQPGVSGVCSVCAVTLVAAAHTPLLAYPGHTFVTLMPRCSVSMRRLCMKPISANFAPLQSKHGTTVKARHASPQHCWRSTSPAHLYALRSVQPNFPATELTLTMWPCLRSNMPGRTALVTATWPR